MRVSSLEVFMPYLQQEKTEQVRCGILSCGILWFVARGPESREVIFNMNEAPEGELKEEYNAIMKEYESEGKMKIVQS